ncbi:MAG: 5'/3'-nucleotidase SurE [Anaerolineae bacterium]|nr:5'/3'-nucleotidase SurE [Anaerolineae bacterium]
MHILVANDDGVFAPGIAALAAAMVPLGKVSVVTCSENRSAIGHRKTMHKPIRIDPVDLAIEGVTAYATDASPSDSIAVALLGLLDEPVDLVVSGINRGPNMGQDLTYSGTVSAAFEAVIFGKPALAFSLLAREADADYSAAAAIAQKLVRQNFHTQLPPLTLLNVNIPALPLDQIKGVKIVRQGVRTYNDVLIKRIDPYGRPYYWIGGAEPSGNTDDPDTDLWAIHNGYVSITPVHLNMTNQAFMQTMETWDIDVS